MRRKLWALVVGVLWYLYLSLGLAQNPGGRLEALNHPETLPSRPISLLFRATGPLHGPVKVQLPPGWTLLLPPEEVIDLPEGQATTLLLVIQPSPSTPEGMHTILLQVGSVQAASRVRVQGVRALHLTVAEAPPWADGPYKAMFLLANRGTRKERVTLKAWATLSKVEGVAPAALELDPGQEAKVSVTLRPQPPTGEVAVDFVRLEAEGEGVRAAATANVTLLPKPGTLLERFHTLPARLVLEYTPRGWTYALTARGPTASGAKDLLDLRLKPSEVGISYRKDPFFGEARLDAQGLSLKTSWQDEPWEVRTALAASAAQLSATWKSPPFRLTLEALSRQGVPLLGVRVTYRKAFLLAEPCPLEEDCTSEAKTLLLEAQVWHRRALLDVAEGPGGESEARLSVGLPPWQLDWGASRRGEGWNLAFGLSRSLESFSQVYLRASLESAPKSVGRKDVTAGFILPWPTPKDRLSGEVSWQGELWSLNLEWREAQGLYARLRGTLGASPTLQAQAGLVFPGNPALKSLALTMNWHGSSWNPGAAVDGEVPLGEGTLTYEAEINSQGFRWRTSYALAFRLPLYLKPGLGQVSGQVRNPRGEPIEGLYLTLGRLATRTDAEGRFWFPAVPEGEHVLAFLSTGYLSQPPLPLRLAVKAGEEVRLDLTLMPTGVVRGRIRLVLPEPEPGVIYGIPDLNPEKLLASLLVEARQGDQIIRRYTDGQGTFYFGALTPGRWQIRIFFDRFPGAYRLEPDFQEVEITSGANVALEFRLYPLPRPIQFEEEESL